MLVESKTISIIADVKQSMKGDVSKLDLNYTESVRIVHPVKPDSY